MANKIILCPPDYYKIEYQINEWMDVNNKVDTKNARQQYMILRELIESLGDEVMELIPIDGLPDMVYVRDHALNLGDGKFLLTNMSNSQREAETNYAQELLEQNGYEVINIDKKYKFEGGDFFQLEDMIIMGESPRTIRAAIEQIQSLVDVEIFMIPICNSRYFHLDTCFFPIDTNSAIVLHEAFDDSTLSKIKTRFANVYQLNREDVQQFSTNLLVLGQTVLGYKFSTGLRQFLERSRFKVIEVDVSEYHKGGGSVHCITLEV